MRRGKRNKIRAGVLLTMFFIAATAAVIALCLPVTSVGAANGQPSATVPPDPTPTAEITATPAPSVTPAPPEDTAAPGEGEPEAPPIVLDPGFTPEAAYDYSQPVPEREAVDDGWFSDAVFIGNSRTEGFSLYSGLKGIHAYASRGLMVDTIFTEPLITVDGERVSVMDALRAQGGFQKAYIMLGMNELGWVYGEIFAEDYGKIIDALREINPEVEIYVQSILPVSQEKSDSDGIYNNPRIEEFNALLREMCEEKQVYYVNVAEAVSDASGALPEDAAEDGVHLSRVYCEKWLAYLKTHTVDGSK